MPDRHAVAAPLIDPDGSFLAAICAVGGPEAADLLPEIGQRLLDAVEGWKFPPSAAAPVGSGGSSRGRSSGFSWLAHAPTRGWVHAPTRTAP